MQLVDSIKWHLSNHKNIVCAFYTRGAVYENEIYPFVEKLEKHREELSPIYYEDDTTANIYAHLDASSKTASLAAIAGVVSI